MEKINLVATMGYCGFIDECVKPHMEVLKKFGDDVKIVTSFDDAFIEGNPELGYFTADLCCKDEDTLALAAEALKEAGLMNYNTKNKVLIDDRLVNYYLFDQNDIDEWLNPYFDVIAKFGDEVEIVTEFEDAYLDNYRDIGFYSAYLCCRDEATLVLAIRAIKDEGLDLDKDAAALA